MNTRDFKPNETRLSELFEQAPTNRWTLKLGKGRNLQKDVSGAPSLVFDPRNAIQPLYEIARGQTQDVKGPKVSRRMNTLGIIAFDEIDLNAKQKGAVSEHLDVSHSRQSLPIHLLAWQRCFDYTRGQVECGAVPPFQAQYFDFCEESLTKGVLAFIIEWNATLDYASDKIRAERIIEGALYRLDRARATRYPEREVMALAAEIRAEGWTSPGSLKNRSWETSYVDNLLVRQYDKRPEIHECLTTETSLEDIIRICSCAIKGIPRLGRSGLKNLVIVKLRNLEIWKELKEGANDAGKWFYEDVEDERFTPPFDPRDWRETVEAFGALRRRCGVPKELPDRQVFAVSYKHERRFGLCRMTADTFFQITTALGDMSYSGEYHPKVHYPKVQLWIDTLNSVKLKERGVKWVDVGLAPYRKYKVVVGVDSFANSERRDVTRLWLAMEMGLGYENQGLIATKRVTYFNSPVGTLALEPKIITRRRWQASRSPVERTLQLMLSKQTNKYAVTYESDRREIVVYVRRLAAQCLGPMDPALVVNMDAEVEHRVACGISQPMKTTYDYRKEFGCVINAVVGTEHCCKGVCIWSHSSKPIRNCGNNPFVHWVLFNNGNRGIALGVLHVTMASFRRHSFAIRVAKRTNGHVSAILEAERLFDDQFIVDAVDTAKTCKDDPWTCEKGCSCNGDKLRYNTWMRVLIKHLSETGVMAWLGPATELEVGVFTDAESWWTRETSNLDTGSTLGTRRIMPNCTVQ